MSQDQPFIWKNSLGGPISWVGQSLWGSPRWVNSVSQIDGVSDMAPACWLCWGGFSKGTTATTHLDVRNFIFSQYATGARQAAKLVLELRGCVWLCIGESMCGFFKRNCLRLQKFLPSTQSLLMFAARNFEDLSSWHWNPGLGKLVWGWDSPLLRYPFQTFIHHMWVRD